MFALTEFFEHKKGAKSGEMITGRMKKGKGKLKLAGGRLF